jgi:hypothetical protein
MNDRTAWHTANDAYLAAALLWLRLRLQRLAEEHRVPTDAAPPATSRGFWSRARDEAAQESVAPRRLPDPTGQIEQAAAALQKAGDVEPPPALVILNRRLGLGTFEGQILLLCAAMELDTRIGPLCAQAQGDARSYPTFALALALFDDPVWEALSPERPLRHWRLIEINQPAAQPLTISALRADERVVSYLKGLNYVDDRLTPFLTPLPEASQVLPPTHQRYVDLIVRDLQAGQGLPVVHLLGADVASKQVVASHVGARLELEVFRLSADMLPVAWADLETLARLWQRESYLSPVALFLDAHDAEKELPAVSRFLGRTSGLVFLDTRDPWPQSARDELAFEIDRPSSDEQREIWSTLLGDNAGEAPQRLAGQFTLSQAQIQRVSSLGTREGEPAFDRMWQACVVASRPRLDTLAQRLDVKALSWDDLVLPRDEKALLRQIMDQVGQRHHVYETWGFGRRMSRGLGISALFAGESGTGKTLAAEVIAGELQLNLYRIDLSQVVSKYIGETEKNLRKLFDAAEDGGSILFFDEADALFGKRSEVKDSHDRYANIEINYLLQRMDVYRGLAILATNMKGALDTAFMRRLRFVVNFPFPGVPERQRIWARAFPDQAETDGLDYARLARLNLTGGSIQNIAVNAAFLAARADSHITMALIADAVRGEFRKLDKPVNEADFRMLFRDVVTV